MYMTTVCRSGGCPRCRPRVDGSGIHCPCKRHVHGRTSAASPARSVHCRHNPRNSGSGCSLTDAVLSGEKHCCCCGPNRRRATDRRSCRGTPAGNGNRTTSPRRRRRALDERRRRIREKACKQKRGRNDRKGASAKKCQNRKVEQSKRCKQENKVSTKNISIQKKDKQSKRSKHTSVSFAKQIVYPLLPQFPIYI